MQAAKEKGPGSKPRRSVRAAIEANRAAAAGRGPPIDILGQFIDPKRTGPIVLPDLRGTNWMPKVALPQPAAPLRDPDPVPTYQVGKGILQAVREAVLGWVGWL